MKTFLKINVFSFIYALGLFIPIEFLLNVYRFSRLTGLDVNNILTINGIILIISIFLTWYTIYVISKFFKNQKKIEITIYVFWFMYFFVFTYLRNVFFPFTNEGDIPSFFLGMVLIFSVVIYPIYIMISQFSIKTILEKNNKTR